MWVSLFHKFPVKVSPIFLFIKKNRVGEILVDKYIMLYYIILYYFILLCFILYSIILLYFILHYIILYYIIFQLISKYMQMAHNDFHSQWYNVLECSHGSRGWLIRTTVAVYRQMSRDSQGVCGKRVFSPWSWYDEQSWFPMLVCHLNRPSWNLFVIWDGAKPHWPSCFDVPLFLGGVRVMYVLLEVTLKVLYGFVGLCCCSLFIL